MSKARADLKRIKLSDETRAWLQAEAHVTNKSQQEIVRTVLHDIALKRIRAAKVLIAMAPAEGHERDGGGQSE